MKWLSIKKNELPDDYKRVLTFSKIYWDHSDELAYRIMDGQFVKMCKEVTHYMYLEPPKKK